MTEEQENAFGDFAEIAYKRGVSVGVLLIVGAVMLEADDWRATLNDITRLLYDSKDGLEFERRFFIEYPGQEVEPGFAEDDE